MQDITTNGAFDFEDSLVTSGRRLQIGQGLRCRVHSSWSVVDHRFVRLKHGFLFIQSSLHPAVFICIRHKDVTRNADRGNSGIAALLWGSREPEKSWIVLRKIAMYLQLEALSAYVKSSFISSDVLIKGSMLGMHCSLPCLLNKPAGSLSAR
ncbi:hypothetical protein KC318_g61 [Hortaea werneckii]|nr:hypothetical protein KC334_g58 [Hortaea werneckii]KAI7676797.1 hypothetical protein KC318_g61 [Hortaea werneckii]